MSHQQYILTVNGERVPPELMEAERARLAALDGWAAIEDPSEREALLQQASEKSAIDRVLLRQEIQKDSRPIDENLIQTEMAKFEAVNGCRSEMTGNLRGHIEIALRQERLLRELAGPAPRPRVEDIRAFYEANLERFHKAEEIRAAHIVRHVDEKRMEANALAAITDALAELEAGQPFAAVADLYSDCKGKGGDLGFFERGVMLEDFDRIVFALNPGERSGIFRTSFGFHIAEVKERRPARTADFQEVAQDLEGTLIALLDQRSMEEAFDRIRSRASVERLLAEAA